MASLHLTLALPVSAVVAQGGCVQGQARQVAYPAVLSSGFVAAHGWRVFSEVFPVLQPGGFRIQLSPDGSAETSNLAGVAAWAVNTQGELELRAPGGQNLWTFKWYPHKGLLVSCPQNRHMPVPTVLAREGLTHADVTERLRALMPERCAVEDAG